MEVKSQEEFRDYWNELAAIDTNPANLDVRDSKDETLEDGEQEVEWLRDAGLSDLTESFHEGREITESELINSTKFLSKQQTNAVKRRVKSLNNTVRNKYRQQRNRVRKPDIRDVFRDIEVSSTGTRSRSATPDSLDSEEEPLMVKIQHQRLKRTPSAPLPPSPSTALSSYEIFGKSQHVDIASDTEGIRLVAYQHIGTVHKRRQEESATISFEKLYKTDKDDEIKSTDVKQFSESEHIYVESITDLEMSRLKSLLWLELSAIFDKNNVIFKGKRKNHNKRKKKESGNVFGVPLATLVMRDRSIGVGSVTGRVIPEVFRLILEKLESDIYCGEEGILRVAGHKQRVEHICLQIESDFYKAGKPHENIKHLLTEQTTCHELSSILKKLLRELPQPLLTSELVELFYDCHQFPNKLDVRGYALNLLVLLLPVEHRATLGRLLSFLMSVVAEEHRNKMSLHNVAMIIAPTLFPPVSLARSFNLDTQLHTAAVCCSLVETMLCIRQTLFCVPLHLWLQMQKQQQHVLNARARRHRQYHVR